MTLIIFFITACCWFPLISCQYYDVKQYIPSSEVYYGHAIPPSQTFATTYDYYYNTLYLPVILLGIGILALIIYQTILCFKFFYHRYCPHHFEWCYNKKSAAELDYHERMKFHQRAIYAFFISLALALIINCLVFISKTSLTTSVHQHLSSMNQISNTFTNINTQSDDLSIAINALKTTLATTNCRHAFESVNAYDTMQTSLTSSDTELQQVTSIVSVLPPKIDFEMNYVTTKVEPNMSLAIWLYWALVMFWVFFLTAIFFCRTKVVLTAAIVATEILIIVLAVISTIELAVVHVTADGCMDTSYTVLTVSDYLKLPSDFVGLASYYSTCNGTNPLMSPYNQGLTALTSFNSTLNNYLLAAQIYMEAKYSGDQCLNTIKSDRNNIFTSLYDMYDSFAYCPSIYNIWYLGVNDSVCTSGYKGLYIIWIIHILTLTMLYITLISASLFFEMYYPTHAINNGEGRDEENRGGRGSGSSSRGNKYDDDDDEYEYESQQPLSPRPIEYEEDDGGNNKGAGNNGRGYSSRIVIATKVKDDGNDSKHGKNKKKGGGEGNYDGYFNHFNERDTQHTSPHSTSVTSSPTRSPDKLMKHHQGGKSNSNSSSSSNKNNKKDDIRASGRISYDTLYNNNNNHTNDNDDDGDDDVVVEMTENRMSMYSNNSANTSNTASNRHNLHYANSSISPRTATTGYTGATAATATSGTRIKNNNNSTNNNNNDDASGNSYNDDNTIITPRSASTKQQSTLRSSAVALVALTEKIAVTFPPPSASAANDLTVKAAGGDNDEGNDGFDINDEIFNHTTTDNDNDDDGGRKMHNSSFSYQNNSNHKNNNNNNNNTHQVTALNTNLPLSSPRVLITPRLPPPPSDTPTHSARFDNSNNDDGDDENTLIDMTTAATATGASNLMDSTATSGGIISTKAYDDENEGRNDDAFFIGNVIRPMNATVTDNSGSSSGDIMNSNNNDSTLPKTYSWLMR